MLRLVSVLVELGPLSRTRCYQHGFVRVGFGNRSVIELGAEHVFELKVSLSVSKHRLKLDDIPFRYPKGEQRLSESPSAGIRIDEHHEREAGLLVESRQERFGRSGYAAVHQDPFLGTGRLEHALEDWPIGGPFHLHVEVAEHQAVDQARADRRAYGLEQILFSRLKDRLPDLGALQLVSAANDPTLVEVERIDHCRRVRHVHDLGSPWELLLQEALHVALAVGVELQAGVVEEEHSVARLCRLSHRRRVERQIPLKAVTPLRDGDLPAIGLVRDENCNLVLFDPEVNDVFRLVPELVDLTRDRPAVVLLERGAVRKLRRRGKLLHFLYRQTSHSTEACHPLGYALGIGNEVRDVHLARDLVDRGAVQHELWNELHEGTDAVRCQELSNRLSVSLELPNRLGDRFLNRWILSWQSLERREEGVEDVVEI